MIVYKVGDCVIVKQTGQLTRITSVEQVKLLYWTDVRYRFDNGTKTTGFHKTSETHKFFVTGPAAHILYMNKVRGN